MLGCIPNPLIIFKEIGNKVRIVGPLEIKNQFAMCVKEVLENYC